MREIFNQDDIDANRQGKLSPAQLADIKSATSPRIWVWGTLICLVLAAVVFLLSDGFSGALGFLGWLMAAILLFCLARWVMIWNMRRALLNDRLTMEDGSVTFKKLDALDQLRYSPETRDGKRLYPSGLAGLSAMLPPGDYRFYYLPHRKWLLSAEPLSTEGELTANMIAVLGGVFGFDPADLAALRAQAENGEVETVEGQPKIETFTSTSDETGNVVESRMYANIGGVQFEVPSAEGNALIPNLTYRLYYYASKPTDFVSEILSLNSDVFIAAIEPL